MRFKIRQRLFVLLLVVAGDWEVLKACGAVLGLIMGCALLVLLKDYLFCGELTEIGL